MKVADQNKVMAAVAAIIAVAVLVAVGVVGSCLTERRASEEDIEPALDRIEREEAMRRAREAPIVVPEGVDTTGYRGGSKRCGNSWIAASKTCHK